MYGLYFFIVSFQANDLIVLRLLLFRADKYFLFYFILCIVVLKHLNPYNAGLPEGTFFCMGVSLISLPPLCVSRIS